MAADPITSALQSVYSEMRVWLLITRSFLRLLYGGDCACVDNLKKENSYECPHCGCHVKNGGAIADLKCTTCQWFGMFSQAERRR